MMKKSTTIQNPILSIRTTLQTYGKTAGKKIIAMDIRGARNAARNRIERKRKVRKYIINKVQEIKADIVSIKIMDDVEVKQVPCALTTSILSLRLLLS